MISRRSRDYVTGYLVVRFPSTLIFTKTTRNEGGFGSTGSMARRIQLQPIPEHARHLHDDDLHTDPAEIDSTSSLKASPFTISTSPPSPSTIDTISLQELNEILVPFLADNALRQQVLNKIHQRQEEKNSLEDVSEAPTWNKVKDTLDDAFMNWTPCDKYFGFNFSLEFSY